MIPLDRVRAAGCSEDDLKSIFTNLDAKGNEKAKAWVESIRGKIRAGINHNIRDYRIYWALDRAFDAPFYQVAYTQLQGLIDTKKSDDKAVLSQIHTWGLTHLLPDVIDPKTGKVCCNADGKPQKALNLPVFFNIFIPLVCAYITIRWAKLFNDRNLTPLYKFEPIKFSKNNRLRCEIITELIQIISTLYDYKSDERQAILQTLLYGLCLKFPREAWHQVYQEGSDGKKKLIREGLRFNMPHPSRMYWDLFHRTSTINSDTGVRYMGYWEIVSYKEVFDNPDYWNKDKIEFGVNSWFSSAPDFFSTVYPCVLTFPVSGPSTTQGAGALDRENAAAYYTYGEHKDKATLQTQHFEKVIPKEVGLGTYEYPVWFRLIMANDGAVLWAEPLGYTPGAYYGYDADSNRSRNKSLALEVLPFQDLLSQVFSQWNLSVRQNLINPIFYNEDMVPQEVISELANLGEKSLRTRVFIPFSKTENIRLGEDQREAFFSPPITGHDTTQLSSLIRGVLDVLDRVLVLSSQEIGQSAPHEQTAEEVRVIQGTTSIRLDFTGSFIDDGIFATKKMLYDALIAYAHPDFTATVSSDYGDDGQFKTLLENLKLELLDDSDADSVEGKVTIKGKKSSIELENFASTRDAANRIDNAGVAAAMAQIFQAVANNPVLIQVLGAPQVVELLNQVIAVSGLPKEFKLKVAGSATLPASPEDQQKSLQEQLVKFAQQIKGAIDQSAAQTEQKVLSEAVRLVEPVAQSVQALNQREATQEQQQDQAIVALQQSMQQIGQMLQAAAAMPHTPGPAQLQPQNELPEGIPAPGPAIPVA
jgi:hypothetical protein